MNAKAYTFLAAGLLAVTIGGQHYGWKVGGPTYLLAGLMGASRIHEDKHWLSDVVAGAALGMIVGRTVARLNGRSLERVASGGTTFRVSPIVARHARGVQVPARSRRNGHPPEAKQ